MRTGRSTTKWSARYESSLKGFWCFRLRASSSSGSWRWAAISAERGCSPTRRRNGMSVFSDCPGTT